jgi:CheY-like chemotaxis protein
MKAPPVLLLVEDDRDDVFFLRRALDRIGASFPVSDVHDGEQAIAYLTGTGAFEDRSRFPAPTHLLLDLKLPRRSGLEVLEWLRGRNDPLAAIPVSILSSSGQTVDRERARILGADHYWTKPVSYDGLQNVVEQIVSWVTSSHID